MPGRPRGLRRAPGRVRRAGQRALRPVPGGQPRPGGAGRDRHRGLLAPRGRGRAVDQGERRPRRASSSCGGWRPSGPARRWASSTPARAIPCGSTCCRPPRRTPCMDEMGARVSAIGHTHVALAFTRADGKVGGTAGGGRDRDRHLRRRVADQPRQRRPAARRRSARRRGCCWTPTAGPRAGTGPTTRSTRPRRPSRPRGCRAASPSDCSWASESARLLIPLVVARRRCGPGAAPTSPRASQAAGRRGCGARLAARRDPAPLR